MKLDERSLLLLGMLVNQSQHGYQINDFIERNLSRVADMKKSTAYSILDRLASSGYVEMSTKQEGNRPPRKVYSITPSGQKVFRELLMDNLAAAEGTTFVVETGLMFMNHAPADEVHECLEQRLKRIREQQAAFASVPNHAIATGVNLAMDHHLAMLKAEEQWLREALASKLPQVTTAR